MLSMLFDPGDRTAVSPKASREALSSFLDRVAGPFWDRVRGLLNKWVIAYPESDREELLARLSCSDDGAFRAAFWELFLFHLLTAQGYVAECHPVVPGTTKRPDFLVTGNGADFYLEAKVVEDDQTYGARARDRDEIWDGLNQRVTSEHFFLMLEIDRYGPNQIPITKLADFVASWLPTLDVAHLRELFAYDGLDAMPVNSWTDEASGWELTATPIPKQTHSPEHRLVGVGGAEVGFRNDRDPIRRSLRKKYSRYGDDFDRPLVVALGVNRPFYDDTDMLDALLGDEVYTVTGPNQGDGYLSRAGNGVWWGSNGPRATRLSAVLSAALAFPWSLASVSLTLWLHPSPGHQLNVRFTNAVSVEPVDGAFVRYPPQATTAEVFGLPADWPGPEPAFPAES